MKFNKKGIVGTKLGLALLALLVLVLFFFWIYGSGGLLEGIKNAYKGVKKIVPEVSVGAEELKGEKLVLPTEQEAPIKQLIGTIKSMLASNKNNCFANYGSLPNLVGVVIELSESNIKVKTLKEQVYFIEEIPGLKPCVIAGKETVQNFDKSFLNTNPVKNLLAGHYRPVSSLTLGYYEGKTLLCNNANHIVVPELGLGFESNLCDNLNDAGFLYTPDHQHICFFPTVYGNNICDGSDKDGLDDDCLGGDPTEDISIPRQIKEQKLTTCQPK